MNDDKGSGVDIDVLDNHDGSFTIKYAAPHPGMYQLRVVFAGTEIPGSPIRVNVQPHLDVGGIRVEGLDSSMSDSKSKFLTFNSLLLRMIPLSLSFSLCLSHESHAFLPVLHSDILLFLFFSFLHVCNKGDYIRSTKLIHFPNPSELTSVKGMKLQLIPFEA